MLGAIIGDIVGSRFEFMDDIRRRKDFVLFTPSCMPTDDTFMTLAVAEALLLSKGDTEALKENGLEVKEFCESQEWAAVVLCHDSL